MGHYIPKDRVHNNFFKEVNGLDEDWIIKRTGIHSRSKISENEDPASMGIEAVKDALKNLPFDISDVDLIISTGYTITDTVGTVAHRVQREFNIPSAIVFSMTSACSSFVNAIEVVETFFVAKRAKKALVICSEANSIFNDYTNPVSGHLWGDGAVAVFLTAEQCGKGEPKILDVATKGLGHIGKGPDGVSLYTNKEGIIMHDGRDVFQYACKYMTQTLEEILVRNNKSVSDLDYIATHQANLRIVANIATSWGIPDDKFLNNIQELGNTGSASAALSLMQNIDKVKSGNLVGLTVFGGGYSSGALLIQF